MTVPPSFVPVTMPPAQPAKSNGGPDQRAPGGNGGPYPMGLVALLATVGMLFAAFGAALLVRRTGADWSPVALPAIVWPNTLVLLVSSVTVELARRAIRRSRSGAAARWLSTTVVLGVMFVVGQVVAWGMLAARGVFLPSNPHAAFFYMLTAVHGAHVLGGLAALGWTLRRCRQGCYAATSLRGLTHTAIYWHVVGALWVYLLVLLLKL